MVRGRIEKTPSEQLVELRKARDRYAAMADHLKTNPGPTKLRQETRQRERDARRIADAYEKSISNMISKMIRARPTPASLIDNLGMARPLFALAVALVALLAVLYPSIFESGRLRAGPETKPVHVVPANSLEAVSGGPKMENALQNATLPVPNPRPSLEPDARHTASVLRPTAVAEQIRPSAKTGKPTARAPDIDSGFVTKVLQPDGTLKEEHFSAAPSR
jgi:hypothetical protein